MCKRHYNSYSPFAALKNTTKLYGVWSRHGPFDVSSGDFNFSYAFDITCALFPGFIDGSAINKMFNRSSLSSTLLAKYTSTSAGWTKESIRENLLKTVYTYKWKCIRSMAIWVAISRHKI